MNKFTKFKEELESLLAKYNATIYFSVGDCSDTYMLYDEKLIVTLRSQTQETSSTVTEEYTLAQGWGVDATDLRDI